MSLLLAQNCIKHHGMMKREHPAIDLTADEDDGEPVAQRVKVEEPETNSEFDATVTLAAMARFLTRPTEPPSGVSAGHMIPHCVLCSLRGWMSLPDFSIGVLTRRRWDKVA